MQISCSTRWAEGIAPGLALTAMRFAGFEAIDIVVSDAQAARAWVDVLKSTDSPKPVGLCLANAETPEQIREGVSLARELSLRTLALCAGPRRELSMQYFVQALELVLADLPLGVGIELVNRTGTRLEQLEDYRELLVLLGRRRWSIAIDAVEFHRASVNPCDALREMGDRMGRLIVGDLLGDRRVPLGEGEVNVAALVEHARRIGYDGSVVLDPLVNDPVSADTDLRLEYRRLRKIVVKEEIAAKNAKSHKKR
jgi:sugar phosphate isomerase/epimerase